MKISEFISGRNVSYDTVRRYIRRNEELFKGHIGKPGNIVLDDYAVELLDQQYPLPNPVEIIEDTAALRELNETRKQLTEMQQLVIRLQQQLTEAAPKIALAEQNHQLLLESEKRIREVIEEKSAVENELEGYKIAAKNARSVIEQENSRLGDENTELKDENSALKEENQRIHDKAASLLHNASWHTGMKIKVENLVGHIPTEQWIDSYTKSAEDKISELKAQLEQERAKTWWDKLRGR